MKRLAYALAGVIALAAVLLVAFGPALVFGEWHAQAAYWIGPVVGSVLAALLWERVLLKKD